MKTKIFTLFCAIAASTFIATASTYYVRTSGADTNDGLTSETAFLTLTNAVNALAASGDVIDILGSYSEPFDLNPNKSFTIQGGNKATTVISCSAAAKRFLNISTNNVVTVENVTIQDFNYTYPTGNSLGGVFNVDFGPTSSLTCRNVNFLNNKAYDGGAIRMNGGKLVVEDCYFYGNMGLKVMQNLGSFGWPQGGAISIEALDNMIDVKIDRCLFEANVSEFKGSAIYFRSTNSSTQITSKLLIQNSTFTANEIALGGFSLGGAIHLDGSNNANKATKLDVQLINNTIAYNVNKGDMWGQAGVYVWYMDGSIANPAPQLKFCNNILFKNLGSTGEIYSSFGGSTTGANYLMKECRNNIMDYNDDFDTKTVATFSTGNITSATDGNLKLASTLSDNGGENQTLALAAGSNAIDGGYETRLAVDQRNFIRVGITDVGAYEFGAVITAGLNNEIIIDNKLISVKQGGIVSNQEGSMQVISFTGFVLKSMNVTAGQFIQLNNGAYILKLKTAKGYSVQKFIL